ARRLRGKWQTMRVKRSNVGSWFSLRTPILPPGLVFHLLCELDAGFREKRHGFLRNNQRLPVAREVKGDPLQFTDPDEIQGRTLVCLGRKSEPGQLVGRIVIEVKFPARDAIFLWPVAPRRCPISFLHGPVSLIEFSNQSVAPPRLHSSRH